MRFPLSDKSRRPPIGEKSTGLKTAITGTIQFMSNITPELLALGFILYVVFLFSTTCHEAAHALAAKIGGDQTAFLGGQVTLNPVPHIQREPWGMVIIPILMLVMTGSLLGWASAPYDPNWARRHPRRAAWMALAGPATNYTLMLIAAIAISCETKRNQRFLVARRPQAGSARRNDGERESSRTDCFSYLPHLAAPNLNSAGSGVPCAHSFRGSAPL